MIPAKPRFVIWGYGSENMFRDFGAMLIAKGHEVLFLPDETLSRHAELQALLRAPYILLTSAHFGRDTRILHDFYPDIHIGNEFLDILHHCPPILSVFYPHDLSTPLVINEPLLLEAFDLVLWPTPFFGYQPRPRKLIDVGWIGFHAPSRPPTARQYDSVLLFSDICHHMHHFGVAGTYAKLMPILETGTAIKFPNWPGHEAFEEYFADHGTQVISAATPAGSVIQDSRLIISNSLSSISIEAAYMGTPVINLLEDYLPKGLQKSFLAGLSGCVLSRYADFSTHLANPPKAAPPRVKRFDAEQVLNIILTEAAQRSHLKRQPPCHIEVLTRPELVDTNPRPAIANVPSPPTEAVGPVSAALLTTHIAPAPTPLQTDEDELKLATAQRLLALDRIEEAFIILQDLASTSTPLAEPYHQIALLALKQGEKAIAEEFLTLACEREQPPGEAHLELAKLHFAAQRFEDTLSILSPLLRYGPTNNPDALGLLRRTLGAAPELGAIAWARLLTDLKWHPR